MNKPEITKFITRPGGLGTLLSNARVGANLSMQRLGDRMGFNSSKIAKIETGKQLPTRSEVISWARCCDVDDEQMAAAIAAWDELNATFSPIASRARRVNPTGAATDMTDENFRAGYDQGYRDAIRDMQNRLAILVEDLPSDAMQPSRLQMKG